MQYQVHLTPVSANAKTIVGFPAHGTGKKKAQNAARVIPIMKA